MIKFFTIALLFCASLWAADAPQPKRETFATPLTSLALGVTPDTDCPILVFWNGLLLAEPEDYISEGSTITFHDPYRPARFTWCTGRRRSRPYGRLPAIPVLSAEHSTLPRD